MTLQIVVFVVTTELDLEMAKGENWILGFQINWEYKHKLRGSATGVMQYFASDFIKILLGLFEEVFAGVIREYPCHSPYNKYSMKFVELFWI